MRKMPVLSCRVFQHQRYATWDADRSVRATRNVDRVFLLP
jgi:hypothetical protein